MCYCSSYYFPPEVKIILIPFFTLFMYRALSKKWSNTADTSGRLFMIDGVLVDSLYNTPEAKKILPLEEQLQ